ncbi:MAG: exosome complex RNA-binding protein Rrp4 [Candidatus Woesearchaeota archaeon]
MGKLLVKERELVVPGQEIAEGIDYLPGDGSYREENKLISLRLGLFNLDGRLTKIIPLRGKYIPKSNDMVIGRIKDVGISNWRINIGWAFDATLFLKEGSKDYIPNGADLGKYYDIGEVIVAKITNVFSSKAIDLSMKAPGCRKLTGGRVIEVEPSKVPRIIGKQGSMISMIKDATECYITVGQNGLVWISGPSFEKEKLATDAIKKVEQLAHSEGLTDKISEFLKENKK